MRKVIITGACGFIGTCLTRRLVEQGVEVIGLDNLSRNGSEINLVEIGENLFTLYRVNLSDSSKTFDVFSRIGPVDAMFHLASQVAVTRSYIDRQRDFEDNAVASFNVIEAIKRYSSTAYCVYASTNKVYGHIQIREPVGNAYPLQPYTPYGVSKAVGELYFTEYGREELGLKTCCLRQSCIYGHHQFGVEDQGWVAWFGIANVLGLPITVYGDGEQVRDLLFIDDLIDLYLECWEKRVTGVYPVGGGVGNAMTVNQGLDFIAAVTGKPFRKIRYDKGRPGDQTYFVADLSWGRELGLQWEPKITILQGIQQMVDWIRLNENKIRSALRKKERGEAPVSSPDRKPTKFAV